MPAKEQEEGEEPGHAEPTPEPATNPNDETDSAPAPDLSGGASGDDDDENENDDQPGDGMAGDDTGGESAATRATPRPTVARSRAGQGARLTRRNRARAVHLAAEPERG